MEREGFEVNRNPSGSRAVPLADNPVFIMLQRYSAYEDCEYMIAHTEKLVRRATQAHWVSWFFPIRKKT